MVDSRQPGANGKRMLMHLYVIYGADSCRWPLKAGQLVNENELADDTALSEVRNEARQLDRLLDAVTRPQARADAAAQAVTAILADSRPAAPAENIVALGPQARTLRPRFGFGFSQFSGLAALAASLLLGIYVGAAGFADDLIPSALAAQGPVVENDDIVGDLLADLNEDMG
jgi:hypothetical protein